MKKKHIVAAVAGTALEYYDYMLYMHFLVILTPLYLPNNTPGVNALLGFSTFAIGFFAQPIGGIIFGHIGDKAGRKKAMALAIVFSTLGTFSMGLLPTYAQIGFLASILLVFFRCVQCFSVGGEVPGAACFLMENSTNQNRCLRSSYINVAAMLAGIVAALLGYIFTQPYMPDWGWRIPFLMVVFFGYIGFYIRRKVSETPVFQKAVANQQVVKVPLLEVIKKDKLPILCTLGICAGVTAPITMLYGYLPFVITDKLNISVTDVLLVNIFVMSFSVIFLIAMGILGDKIGAKRLMLISGLGFIIVAYPFFSIMNTTQSLLVVMLLEIILSFIIAGVTAPLNVVMTLMFPTGRRYTGCAFAWGLGEIIFGGLSPLIAHGFATLTGNQNAPAIWLILCSILLLFGVKYAPVLNNLSNSNYIPKSRLRRFSGEPIESY